MSTDRPEALDAESVRTRQFLATHHDELVAFRRHLHAYPELSNVEHETTDFVGQRLETAGLVPRVLPSGTGLVCDIGTGDGPVVALRADLDALAMDDEANVPYRSKRPGIAHACGHDVHTTVVLGAGLALARLLEGGPGRVRLLFEPAEESLPAGARDVIDAGGLEDVVAVYGLHCDPKLDVGIIGVRPGPLTAATDLVRLDLHGPGGHTARPQLTVDLVRLAGRLATELPPLVRVGASPLGEALFVWGTLQTGDAPNVIPARAHLAGTFRTPDREVWAAADRLVADAVETIVEGSGATFLLDHQRGVPPVVNDAAETERLASMARGVVGDASVIEAPRSLGGDSFAWYVEEVPGTYARLGVHDPAWGDERGDLHSSTFDVDERAIDIGIEVLVATALDALRAYG
jgi:amidohydrolase